VIVVRELTKVYGQTLAVDHISFEVGKGQIVGFLGATVNGFDIFHQSEQVRENLGYLPENVPLYTEMKVREYLDFRARLRRMDRATRRQRIDYVLERCWLKPVEHKTISHLSKGYRQRVGLADALLHNPAVLILDEPTVGLDPTQIRETRKLIKDLGGHHTVILSTHILPEVEATCDRAIVISAGRIVAQGSPDELRASRRLTARVLVECRGPRAEIEAALLRVSGVSKVEILDGESRNGSEAKYVTAALRAKDGYDIREEAARTVIQHGWPLREIRLEHATLEEFFVQVTADQAAARV
jgi:ABC-2 type transport system ATP-binding protein